MHISLFYIYYKENPTKINKFLFKILWILIIFKIISQNWFYCLWNFLMLFIYDVFSVFPCSSYFSSIFGMKCSGFHRILMDFIEFYCATRRRAPIDIRSFQVPSPRAGCNLQQSLISPFHIPKSLSPHCFHAIYLFPCVISI